MSDKTKSLHFSVGEDLGLRLMEIAREHLLYNHDPQKAINTITMSLVGSTEDFAKQVISGDIVLMVEDQQIMAETREEKHESYFPRFDFAAWIKRQYAEIGQHGVSIKALLELQKSKFRRSGKKFNMNFSMESIFEFVAGNDEMVLEELRYDPRIEDLTSVINVARLYIDKVEKIRNVYGFLVQSYPDMFKDVNVIQHVETVSQVQMSLMELIRNEYDNLLAEDGILDNYISSMKEIDDELSKGIKPVRILDNYSAGWLSPEGEYYGLNGEIANMLHIQLVDAMSEAGIIPTQEDGFDGYRWLETNGWVKVHGNWILYEGYNLHRLKMTNVPMTDVQVMKLYEYGQECHGGILKFGLKMERMSAIKFKSIEPLMRSRLFEF